MEFVWEGRDYRLSCVIVKWTTPLRVSSLSKPQGHSSRSFCGHVATVCFTLPLCLFFSLSLSASQLPANVILILIAACVLSLLLCCFHSLSLATVALISSLGALTCFACRCWQCLLLARLHNVLVSAWKTLLSKASTSHPLLLAFRVEQEVPARSIH